MRRYSVLTKNGYETVFCEFFTYDEFYLKFMIKHEEIAMFSPEHWLSVIYIGEE